MGPRQFAVGYPLLSSAMSQGVQRLTTGGGTALYDAVRTGCQKLLHRPEQDTVARELVVLSNGQNNAGKLSLELPLILPKKPKSPSMPSARTTQRR